MRTKKDFDKQNQYNKETYDHFNLMLPKGKKEELQQLAKYKNLSLNAFINSAIDFYITHNNNADIK